MSGRGDQKRASGKGPLEKPDRLVRISHVGSTAVPGILAKPIVDILVELEPTEKWSDR
ncbi:MAG: GrpB family protein [Clostridiales bacterium]|nr:GrpB family protein [Clostridiales bacterium]